MQSRSTLILLVTFAILLLATSTSAQSILASYGRKAEKPTDPVIPVGDRTSGHIDFCSSFVNVCHDALVKIDCPEKLRTDNACGTQGTIDSFKGSCKCGGLELGTIISDLIIGYQVEESISSQLVGAHKTN
ncbi:hypothetical protein BC937DRAFT_90806 [Endogone sp. FLAS-F59071]|nr:hypothetical protein BC937DRAFT_90806 [Endogone sp. FLAS-F59071]|eukprot:RUS16790.1 hypothetical protein BC937DRAFT_90806 [Endogone sp. FLAS-F59071]